MTNEELIKRFFKRRVYGDEESYGFSVKPLLRESVGNCALFSKTSQFPMAVNLSKNCYVISTPFVGTVFVGTVGKHYEVHNRLTITIAEQLKIKFILSPHADAANFHKYMEERINENLTFLANDLRTGSYYSVPRSTEVDPTEPKYALVSEPEPLYTVPENYQKLMKSIDALLEGERILELPKNQVVLLDTDEVQSLWRWLIKESPIKEERELLRKLYTLSRLLVPHSPPRGKEILTRCP